MRNMRVSARLQNLGRSLGQQVSRVMPGRRKQPADVVLLCMQAQRDYLDAIYAWWQCQNAWLEFDLVEFVGAPPTRFDHRVGVPEQVPSDLAALVDAAYERWRRAWWAIPPIHQGQVDTPQLDARYVAALADEPESR